MNTPLFYSRPPKSPQQVLWESSGRVLRTFPLNNMWILISALPVWEPDLWLGLECLFNEQRLCRCRVSSTNERVSVSYSLRFSLRLCLFIISQIPAHVALKDETLSLRRVGGSSGDHLRWLAPVLKTAGGTWRESVGHSELDEVKWNTSWFVLISKIKFLKSTAGSVLYKIPSILKVLSDFPKIIGAVLSENNKADEAAV